MAYIANRADQDLVRNSRGISEEIWIAKELHELGYQKYGNETMYSGHTGKIKIVPLSPYPLRPGDHGLLPASSLLRFYLPVPVSYTHLTLPTNREV